MKTFEEVQQEVRELHERDLERYIELRREASKDLERELIEWLGEDHGQGIGTSDVSIHLIEMIRCGELKIQKEN